VEIILFTGIGIVLYLLCDRLLILLEKMHGDPLPGRSAIFFVLILTLSLATFSLMRTLLHPGEGSQNDHQEQQAPDRGHQATQSH
jgi:Na+/H+-dicarboxylate symporter